MKQYLILTYYSINKLDEAIIFFFRPGEKVFWLAMEFHL